MTLLIIWIGLALLGVTVLSAANRIGREKPTEDRYGRGRAPDPKTIAAVMRVAGVVSLAFLVLWVVTSTIIIVPPTHAAVMKNEFYGTARYAGPGWRLINPVIERVVIYDMRLQEFQIGQANVTDTAGNITEMRAVDAASNSPGLPLVYLVVTARVKYSADGCPGPECNLVDIELRYGKDKWSELVKDRMEMNAREVAGRRPYDYVGTRRDDFADEVDSELKDDLDSLANIAYVGIPWYDFSKFINEQLDQVAERERELERRAQEVQVAGQEQEKQKVEQETAIMVAEKQAEAKVRAAEGEKAAIILRAEGEAEALRLVGAQLKANPLLIEYQKAQGWNGKLPQYMGVGAVPFLNIEAEQSVNP